MSGFNLEPAEKAIVGNVIKNYEHKISERIKYDSIQLSMKKSQRGKVFRHEVKGKLMVANKMYSSEVTDYNLFSAVAEVMEKLLNEAVHKSRTNRQIK